MPEPYSLTVIADLGGPALPLDARPLVWLDPDDLDGGIRALAPSIALRLPDPTRPEGPEDEVTVRIEALEELDPSMLVRRAPHLRGLAMLLETLRGLRASAGGPGLHDALKAAAERFEEGASVAERGDAATGDGADVLGKILAEGAPSRGGGMGSGDWLSALTGALLPPGTGLGAETSAALDAGITRLETALAVGLDDLLQHPAFMAFEAALRGLERLCRRTQHLHHVRVGVLSATLPELARDLCGEEGPARSVLADRLFFSPLMTGAPPTDLLVLGDPIGASDAEVSLLHGVAHLGAWAQLPVLFGARPELLGVRRWSGLDAIESPAHPQAHPLPEALLSLQRQVASRYLIGIAPTVLSRPLYRGDTLDGLGLIYTEGAGRGRGAQHPEASAALMVAELLAQNPLTAGPGPSRELGSQPAILEGLVVDYQGSGRLKQSVGPLPIPLSDRLAARLSQLGFCALGAATGQPRAALMGHTSLCQVAREDGSEQQALLLGQRLSSTLVLTRWGRRLQRIALDAPETLATLEEAEAWLGTRLEAEGEAPTSGPRILRFNVQAPPADQPGGGLNIQLGLELELGTRAPLWLAGPVWLPMVLADS